MAHWQSINSMAVRRFGDTTLAEEAALAVMEGLAENEWARLKAFNSKASFATFLRTVTARLLEDFARKRFGRVRPPLWVRTLGGLWEKLFAALCLERMRPDEAVEFLARRYPPALLQEIEEVAYQLLARIPDCGKLQGVEIAYEDDLQPDRGGGTEWRDLEEDEKRKFFGYVCQAIFNFEGGNISSNFQKRFARLKIDLKPQQKLLLKLHFQEGINITKAGEMLGLTRFQAHGRMRRLLKRLKKEFERVGLDGELISFLR